MLTRLSKLIVATGAAASISVGALMPRPASADTSSTILTAAAVIGAIVYNNIQRKQAAANTVVGYTQNGGTVYADGRVVMPDGTTYYPNSNNNGQFGYNYPVNNGQYNGQYGYNGPYNNRRYGYNNSQYNNGRYNSQNARNGGRWNSSRHDDDKRSRDRDKH